ncbi:testis-specific Y-encoded protein 3-like [Zalophus californianus]|uniref:Testis-specific Y-encoded protein 3-like n=1 Tax=Zalophus californianus TaxID=9704 RepID=A0A6P9FHY4_ZALCA|nr:testis-specific Y-encoded protein 3-like [Zalophus californianus]
MAAEAVREGEERWESEDAILVEELGLVGGDLRLVLQLVVLEGEDGEDEEDTEEAAEEVDEADTEEEDESREALEALQLELERMKKHASSSYSALRLRCCRRQQRPLEHRSALMRGIPGFWAKAFVNHPQMSAVIRKQDEGHLGYMTDLKVEELRFPRDCRQILLFFRKNPYFRDEVLVKEYVLSAAGYGPSHSTPIQWHQDYEQEAYSRRHHNTSLNSFNWFSDHSFAGSSTITEIIMDDLWPNPLQDNVRKKAPGEGPERTTAQMNV